MVKLPLGQEIAYASFIKASTSYYLINYDCKSSLEDFFFSNL